jgi:hypothetical protein
MSPPKVTADKSKTSKISEVYQNISDAGTGKFLKFNDLLNSKETVYTCLVEEAFNKAEENSTQLSEDILNMYGFSSKKVRILLNEIMRSSMLLEDNIIVGNKKNYLEIGPALGSTFISSLYRNNDTINSATVCDLFLEEKIGKDGLRIFTENCKKHLNEDILDKVRLLNQDCFSIDLSLFENKINFYFFDGPHRIEDHEKSLTYFESIFDDEIVIIIDDWNDKRVQAGTINGLSKIDYSVAWWSYGSSSYTLCQFNEMVGLSSEIKIKDQTFGDKERYWNGIMVLVLKKNKQKEGNNEQR